MAAIKQAGIKTIVSMPQAALGLLQLHGSWSRVLQGLRVSA